MDTWQLVVIGGGAAGLAAGLTAARRGAQVLILERTNECGKKLALTGGKKGNFTHADEPDKMAREFNVPPDVLLKLMRRFPYPRIIQFFAELGIHHLVDEEGCVWPNPKSAPRLRDALVSGFTSAGGEIRPHARALDVQEESDSSPPRHQGTGRFSVPGSWFLVPGTKNQEPRTDIKEPGTRNQELGKADRWRVRSDGGELLTRAVLISTGGMSYPATGSSGDGYELARRLGQRVEPLYSSLASLVTNGEFAELAGITIGKTTVTLRIEGYSPRGSADAGFLPTDTAPFLFAGRSITGRAVINLCGFAGKALKEGRKVMAVVDWLPDASEDAIREEIAGERIRHGKTQVNNFIAAKSAKRLANLLCGRAEVPAERRLAALSRDELQRLLAALKRTEIEIVDTEPLARATVTGGGVALDQVDLSSFESKLHPGLFFAGEVLDVWGRSGGYNLHFAWASGIAAGEAVTVEAENGRNR
jgi:hypothetical protein